MKSKNSELYTTLTKASQIAGIYRKKFLELAAPLGVIKENSTGKKYIKKNDIQKVVNEMTNWKRAPKKNKKIIHIHGKPVQVFSATEVIEQIYTYYKKLKQIAEEQEAYIEVDGVYYYTQEHIEKIKSVLVISRIRAE